MSEEADRAALELRREWEQWRDARDRELEQRYRAEISERDRVEAAATELRVKLTEDLGELLEALKPYVDGTMGEVTAAMSSVYVKAAHEMASWWGLTRAPRPVTAAPVRPEPPLVEDPELVEERRVAAVSAARDEILGQLDAVRRRMLPAAPEQAS